VGEVVFGREAELAEARRFIDALPRGSASLLIEGTAGIGKTTVWQAALRSAAERGVSVLSSRPGPSETRLTYAGLLDLLGTVDPATFRDLPAPQRKALDAALLRLDKDDHVADQRSIATGFLSVLRILARLSPVLIAIDDVQWLDVPTWHVLEFAIRRFDTEPVGLLAAMRMDGDAGSRIDFRSLPKDRLHEIRLRPLTLAALHEVFRAQLGHNFTRPILVRIEQTSGGNPFFALELARAILESGEPVSPSGRLSVPEDLAELLTRRIRRLPAASQDALLVASAMSQPTLDLLDVEAIGRAEHAGVVRIDERGRVLFTHPLIASAVYTSAPLARRRQVHRQLAARVKSAEERARHLALATNEPDEEVARALVEAAHSARARGAPDAAIELVALACERTAPDDRAALTARRFQLGRILSSAGDPQRANAVLSDLVRDVPPGPVRARAKLLLSFVTDWTDGGKASTALCESALIDAGADDELRAEIHAGASRMWDHDPERKSYHAQAALELAPRGVGDPHLRAYALLASAEAQFYAGHGILGDVFDEAATLEASAPFETLDRIDRYSHTMHVYSDVTPSSRLLGILRLYADELDAARAELERDRRASLDHGDEAQLARSLGRLATVELRAGNWQLADRHLGDLQAVVQRTGQGIARHRGLLVKSQLDAVLGHVASARAGAQEAVRIANAAGWIWETCDSYAVLGFVELTAGNVAGAREQLDRADERYGRIGLGDPGFIRYQADHIESLVSTGDLPAAEAALERFEGQARAVGRASALALAARSCSPVAATLRERPRLSKTRVSITRRSRSRSSSAERSS